MQPKPIIDFAELPDEPAEKYVVSAEQICVLCGLNRRTSRRIGKVVFRVLGYFPPSSLLEQSILLVPTSFGWSLSFRFVTDPIEMNSPLTASETPFASLRRSGEKLESFEIAGDPSEGYTVQFAQALDVAFEVPPVRELNRWGRIVARGNWEEAFELVTKSYSSGRLKLKELRDGVSIRRDVLDDDKQQANTILSLIASKTDNAVLLLNAEGQVEWLNQACCQTLGIDPEQSLHKTASELFFIHMALSDRVAATNDLKTSLTIGRSFSIEFFRDSATQATKASDTTEQDSIWTAFQLTPVRDEHDTIARWIVIGADVTQRRKAELAMKAAKEVAETANRAKSQFLAMMSHEIRTPMNAIIGMTELTLGTKLNPEQRDFLMTSHHSAQALLQILNDILDLSKVEASHLQIEQVDFNVADLVRDTLGTLEFLANAKGIDLKCNFPLDIPQQIVGDPVRFRQIIVNLVGNAIKFTHQGDVEFNGELTDESNENASIHFSVRDTGIGIAEEKTSRIFEAFYQTDTSVTRNFGGTGLGLAITSELVRLMGGRIWVESRLGVGSTFHFVLTLPKSNRPVIGITPKSIEYLAGKSVLIVAQNAQAQTFLNNLMTNWGAKTQTESRGSKAIQAMEHRESNFDFILLDAETPEIDGFELARRIQDLGTDSKPILMISSDKRANKIRRCREMGIEAFVVKPVSPRNLSVAIRSALAQSAQVPATHDVMGSLLTWKQTNSPLDVLIVDDFPSNRTLACEILRRRGHRWMQASSGAQAIELIQENRFDVVLMDVQMPDQDGLETTLQIRKLDGIESLVPIIAVTAYVTPDDRQRCLDSQMDDYMSKPLSASELIEKIERWGHTSRSPDEPTVASQNLADQLAIQDVPDWAAQIAHSVAIEVDEAGDETGQMSGNQIDTAWVAKSVEPVVNQTGGSKSDSRPAAMGASSPQEGSGLPTTAKLSQFEPALARLGGDQELLKMQMGFFLEETPQLMNNIAEAIKNQDAQTMYLNAHRLKGLVRSYDDQLAEELATSLENNGRENDFSRAEATLCLLATCISGMAERIEMYQEQSG